MKYTIDTENKTIEFTSLSSSEIIELANKYPDYKFCCVPEVIYSYPPITWVSPVSQPFSQPYYNGTDIDLCGTSSGKWDFGSTTTVN